MADTMQEQIEGFDLDEGSAFDDFVGVITDAYFGTDASYNQGQSLCLIVTFESAEFDKPNRQMFACGKGWTQENNGERAVREDGAKKNFVKTSKVGMFISHALKVGAGHAMKKNGGDQFNAASYRGLKLHMRKIDHDYGGELGVKKVLVPVEFFGVDAAAAGEGAVAAKVIANVAAASSGGDLNPELLAAIKSVAASAATHEEFVDKALAIPGVEDDAKLSAAVLSSKAGSIWSIAQANK